MYANLSSDGFFFAVVALAVTLNIGIMIGRVYQIGITVHTEWMARRAAMAATKARYSRTIRHRTVKGLNRFARAIADRAMRGAADTIALASSLRPSGVPSDITD